MGLRCWEYFIMRYHVKNNFCLSINEAIRSEREEKFNPLLSSKSGFRVTACDDVIIDGADGIPQVK
jgi:hypothetical protein